MADLEYIVLNGEKLAIKDNRVNELSTVATTGSYNDLTDKPNLSTVATTGSYNDLTDKPNLSTVATTGSYNDLTNKPNIQTITYNSDTSTLVIS